jgi:hypothetical protein
VFLIWFILYTSNNKSQILQQGTDISAPPDFERRPPDLPQSNETYYIKEIRLFLPPIARLTNTKPDCCRLCTTNYSAQESQILILEYHASFGLELFAGAALKY